MATLAAWNPTADFAPTGSAARLGRAAWLVALVIGGVFFLTEHDVRVSLHESYTQTADEMEAAASGGNAVRRLAFLLLAGCGVVGLFAARGVASNGSASASGLRIAAFPVVALFAWCFASIAWSDEPGMTARRLSVLGCFALGAAGAARALSLRDLLRIGLAISTAYLVVGVLAEVRLGTFRPWAGDYRFSGSLHPNTQGLNLAVMCLSAYALRRDARRGRMMLLALLACGLLFLILTKSRTATAGVLAALGLVWLLGCAPRMALGAGGVIAWCVSTVLLAVLLSGIDYEAELRRAALLGREEQSESLTGRVPIWTELLPHLAARPLFGYGYDSFWTPSRIETVSTTLQWGIREAHSAYIETCLSIGLLGALLLAASILIGLIQAGRRYVLAGESEAGCLFGLYVFALVDAFSESGMVMPLFVPFFCLTGLLHLTAGPRWLPVPQPTCALPVLPEGAAGRAVLDLQG